MDSSSSSFSPLGPQVFISFCGEDVLKHFISFLVPALRKAKINVFVYEDELLGTDLANLLKRIEESEIAIVIFSKNYASSDSCLDELAKMKERKDEGRLIVIPIFYKVDSTVVKQLRGEFGDNFRELQRNHLHEQNRTKKWKDALISIPNVIGLPQKEQSDQTDFDFIELIVFKIKRLLESMAVRGNLAKEACREGDSMVPAKQVERKANPQAARQVQGDFMVPARKLEIDHGENPQKWAWVTIHEAPSYEAFEIATMIKIHWLKMFGTFKTTDLTPGKQYEAVFVVKLEEDAIGWEKPVTLKLKVEQHDGSDNRVDRTENLKDYIGLNWVDILAGVFVVPPRNTPAKITFTMYQYVTDDRKRGLLVKGVVIRPTN